MKMTLALSLLVLGAAIAVPARADNSAADQSYNETMAQEQALKEGKTWSK